MYTFSNRLKIASFILMAVGVLGIGIGFMTAPSTVEDAKAMVAAHDDGHGDAHAEAGSLTAEMEHAAAHDPSHDVHLLHQLQNNPWSALHVAALFFLRIALGTLLVYAVQRAARGGWSPLLFRVMEGITAYMVPGGIAIFIILALPVPHMNHLFVGM